MTERPHFLTFEKPDDTRNNLSVIHHTGGGRPPKYLSKKFNRGSHASNSSTVQGKTPADTIKRYSKKIQEITKRGKSMNLRKISY